MENKCPKCGAKLSVFYLKPAAQEVTEISLEDLEQVAGGYSLREKKKVETTAISDDTISRI